jgi:Acetyltransferase (GNAT) family
MKLLNWVRFTWDLSKLPPIVSELPEHYQIGPATNEDENELRKVLSSAFVLDPTWSPAMGEVMLTIQSWLDHAFTSEKSTCLTLHHGSRIIGASVLSLDPQADNHLAPGPCILMEYRNRGFGTRLLESSFKLLRENALSRAIGIARENAPVARFLYTKFGGIIVPADFPRLLAAQPLVPAR